MRTVHVDGPLEGAADRSDRFVARDNALRTVGAGRAGEGLRAEWRRQLRRVQKDIGFSYLRFHGLFHDEMCIYSEREGAPLYRWWYLDDLFDFLLETGIRPFVEFGFTPGALASGSETNFEWKANITPPVSLSRWRSLITKTVSHWIYRYGREEVRKWYFEVWNEPNLGGIFWTGTQEEYFQLYRTTVEAVRECDAKLSVGGPGTSNFTTDGEAPWWREFVAWCSERSLPVDFLSCHPYPNGWAFDGDGVQQTLYRRRGSLAEDVAWMNGFRDASPYPEAEIHITEWNSSPSPRDAVHDTAFMGPFLLDSLLSMDGSADSTAYWVFTDIFEENGPGNTLFHGGFGLMTMTGIPKPSYHAYHLLARSGTRLVERGDGYVVTLEETAGRGWIWKILCWNYVDYTDEFAAGDRSALRKRGVYAAFQEGKPVRYRFSLPVEGSGASAVSTRVDREHGSVLDGFLRRRYSEEMTPAEEEILRRDAEPERTLLPVSVEDGYAAVECALAPHGIALLEISTR